MESDWEEAEKNMNLTTNESELDFDKYNLHSIPPGFANGIDFSKQIQIHRDSKNPPNETNSVKTSPEIGDIFSIMDFLSDSSGDFHVAPKSEREDHSTEIQTSERIDDENDPKIDQLLQKVNGIFVWGCSLQKEGFFLLASGKVLRFCHRPRTSYKRKNGTEKRI